MNLTDPRFKWVRPENTNVSATWKKHGWKPTTEAERKARQERAEEPKATITDITSRKRK